MTTYAFLLDLGRCIGCQGCVAACKTGNELSPGAQYITISEQTRGTFPALQSSIKTIAVITVPRRLVLRFVRPGRSIRRPG